jgi:hypothetical protein
MITCAILYWFTLRRREHHSGSADPVHRRDRSMFTTIIAADAAPRR